MEQPRFILRIFLSFALLTGFVTYAKADATVLLEEPYSYDGTLAGTGHTAVYLSRVCADSPLLLRRCKPDERGVVISRYTRIAGHDWVAIPLIPYLYAVEKPEDVPLYADAKLVAFLRDRYRRSYLEEIAPDAASGEMPKGDWIQLVGSSYDRTSYGFQIETTAAQDDAFVAWFNSLPNRTSYNAVMRNCADFVREVINFYYPKAISRGFITDLEVTTPKHAAKSLIKYSRHNPDLEFTRVVFPQVPGTMRRSRPIRGVLESVFRAKKYVLPFAAFHPIIAGAVMSVYIFGDRFNPAKDAMVFNVNGDPESPLPGDERETYLRNLEVGKTIDADRNMRSDEFLWRQFQERARFQMDESGQVIVSGLFADEEIQMGISRNNLMGADVPPELQRGLLLTRFHQELSQGRAPKISASQMRADWRLLQAVNSGERVETSRHVNTGN